MSPRLLLPAFVLALGAGCVIPQSMVDAYLDKDRDGERALAAGGTDCDDTRPGVGTKATEKCGNNIDDDCDGVVDNTGIGAVLMFVDADGDGFGDDDQPESRCQLLPGWAGTPGDCDDHDAARNPNALEDCFNQIDDDCDGDVDEDDDPPIWYADIDRDGYGDAMGAEIRTCRPTDGMAPNRTDCDDLDPNAHPGAVEIPYDGIDNACDGGDDFDVDGDGYLVDPAHAAFPILDESYRPGAFAKLDCDDLDFDIHPNLDDVPYDGIDANCDALDDFDADGDGHARIPEGDDCDDNARFVYPGRAETYYNGVDDNCDPSDDDDADGDGHTALTVGGNDCDDQNAYVWNTCLTCEDKDWDGAWVGCNTYDDDYPFDCNDTPDSDVARMTWSTCATCMDADGDGAFTGCDTYLGGPEDCDDDNPVAWVQCELCRDVDQDGHWVGCMNQQHPDYPPDCDDTVANLWDTCGTCVDLDGDGVGTGTCNGPIDCDDSNPDVWVSCDTCVDEDDDISRTGCDAYTQWPYDCDDANPDVGGHNFEIIGDGLDQDCDGKDLTVADADAVFVAPRGSDTAGCGTMALPCATPGYAAEVGKNSGYRPVFLAAGAYGGFTTDVSVYGGFEDGTWTRDVAANRSWIVFEGTGLGTGGAHVGIDGVGMRGYGEEDAFATLALYSRTFLLRSSVVEVDMVGNSPTLAEIHGDRVQIVDSRLVATGSGSLLRGLNLGGPLTDRVVASFENAEIGITGVAESECVAIETYADSTEISESVVRAEGCVDTTAIYVKRTPPIVSVRGSSVIATSAPQSSAVAVGVAAAGFRSIHVERSSISATSGGSARGLDLAVLASGASLVIDTAFVHAAGNLESVGVGLWSTHGDPSESSIVSATIVSTQGDGVALIAATAGELTVQSSLLRSGTGIWLYGSSSLSSVLLDSPCAVRDANLGGGCSQSTATPTPFCSNGICATFTDAISAPADLDPNSPEGLRPLPTSAAVGLGQDPAVTGASSTDIFGTPRPVAGPWTAGAAEPSP